jgi:GNAT superfamily N-acetyltransferase
MASVLEYQRMPRPGRPDSSWGYLGNLLVREEHRNRGIGSALIATVIVEADQRGYVRLVVSPSSRALPLFQCAGFVAPDEPIDDHRLLVRPARRR